MTLTAAHLHRLAPLCRHPETHAEALTAAIQGSTINSPRRLAHFLGQVLHETGDLRRLEEDLRYSSPERLDALFAAVRGTQDARALIAQGPEAIANRVYANRNGNGPEASGDGWLFRGRGYLMLTGRANYRMAATLVPDPLGADPDLAGQPGPAARIAVALWDRWGLSPLADRGQVQPITRKINGPACDGLAQRRKAVDRAARVLA